MIRQLNPIIRGWTNYHKHVCAKKVFISVSHEIFKAVWLWAKRRHARKGAKWIRRRYFRSQGSRHWVFFAKVRRPKAPPVFLDLMEAGKVKIKRYVKVKAEATPHDPAFRDYFINREAKPKTRAMGN